MTALYRYRAADASGRLEEGSIESVSRVAVIEDLRRRRLVPVDVVEASAAAAPRIKNRKMRLDVAVLLWTRTLATMVAAGIPLERTLEFAASQCPNRNLESAVSQILADVRGGLDLAEAMGKHPRIFDTVYLAMVSTGEASGALGEAMLQLSDYLEESAAARARFRSALVYPALMASVASIGVLVILLFILPRFVQILGDTGGTLPWSTSLLLGISGFISDRWWLLVTAVIAGLLVFRRWVSKPSGMTSWHSARLRLPAVGELELDRGAARFCRVLGLLLKSGVQILPALRIARAALANRYLSNTVETAIDGVAQGRALSAELAPVFPLFAVQLIAAGEETGRLDELSLRAAAALDAEVNRRTQTLIALLEPALIVIFGLVIGFVALAMLQAIYSINTSLT